MSRQPDRKPRREDGFVLVVTIVFLVVLSLTAYLVAAMTRTDVQVVQNIQREKEAFYVAEAGATEVLLRLRRIDVSGNDVTVGGLTFDPDIVPDVADPTWNARITFTMAAPTLAGGLFTTPSLQDPNARLDYSDAVGGANPHVTAAWTGQIVSGRQVLAITSTGRSHRARRTVTIHAIEGAATGGPGQGCFGGGLCSLSQACEAIETSGNCTLTMAGGMVVNSACEANALTCGNNQSITAAGGIDIVGGYTGGCAMSPPANVGATGSGDPLAAVPELVPAACDFQTSDYQGPGVYCKGLRFSGSGSTTLAAGDYVIAGGTLDVSGNHTVSGSGVTFHIAAHPTTGQWGSVDFGPLNDAALVAPTTGTYAGILLFQHRANPNTLNIRGTFRTGLDGLIYAAGAHVDLQNQTNPGKQLNVGMIVGSLECVGDNHLLQPSNTNLPPPTDVPNGYEVIAWDG